jgi:hypothetical protein
VEETLRIIIDDDAPLLAELREAAETAGLSPRSPPRVRGVADILLAIGSAGAFTAVYQIIASVLKKDAERELTLKLGEVVLTVKGHNLPEEQKLLSLLMPKLVPKPPGDGPRARDPKPS